jgi:hypothetical protein
MVPEAVVQMPSSQVVPGTGTLDQLLPRSADRKKNPPALVEPTPIGLPALSAATALKVAARALKVPTKVGLSSVKVAPRSVDLTITGGESSGLALLYA